MASRAHIPWHPARCPASGKHASAVGEGRACHHPHCVLRLLPHRPQTTATAQRQASLDAPLRLPRRSARRSLRHERPAAGHLRSHAPLAAPALPRHPAGLLPPRRSDDSGWLPHARALDAIRHARLHHLSAQPPPRHLFRPLAQPPPPRRLLPEIRPRRPRLHRSCAAAPGYARLIECLNLRDTHVSALAREPSSLVRCLSRCTPMLRREFLQSALAVLATTGQRTRDSGAKLADAAK